MVQHRVEVRRTCFPSVEVDFKKVPGIGTEEGDRENERDGEGGKP